MIKIPFEKLGGAISRGFLLPDDTSDVDDFYLEPVHGVSDPFFITDFNISAYSKHLFPTDLRYIEPFIKFQKTKSRKKITEVQPSPIGFEKNLWLNLWKHLAFSYIFLTYGKNENPWGTIDSTDDDLFEETMHGYYRFLKEINKSDPMLNEFLIEESHPPEFTQMALLKKEVAKHLSNLSKIFSNNTKSDFYSFINGKGQKWVEHLKSKSVSNLWIDILASSRKSDKQVTHDAVVLVCYLFSVEAYLKRMDVTTCLGEAQTILDISSEHGSIPTKIRFKTTLMHFLSKVFTCSDLVQHIKFLPDYYLLNYLARNFYAQTINEAIRTEPSQSIYQELKKNIKNIRYLSITGARAKKTGVTIVVDTDNLGHISNLPPYIYKYITKDLLKTCIEIYGFTKEKLGISPDILYEKFMKYKANQQYDLRNRVDFDAWLEERARRL